MSKRKNSAVSILLLFVAGFLLFSTMATVLQVLPDIGDPDDSIVIDPDNPGTSTGNVRIENLKMYPAYATSGSRNCGYYGFSITDLNPNTTYSLYLSFLKEDGLEIDVIGSDGARYYNKYLGGYGEYDENTSRYGVGALKLRSDDNGVLSVLCMYNSEEMLSDSDHETIVVDIFNHYTVALYTTEDDPSEPPEEHTKANIRAIKTLYSYTLPDNSGTSGSTSGSTGPDHSGDGPEYVLDGNYLLQSTLTVSKDLRALFEDFEESDPYEFYDYTDFKCCTSLFEDCEGYDGTYYYGMKLYYYEGDIDLFYETSKSHTLVYDQPSFKSPEYRYLHFDEVEVSEAFYLFITENSTKVS